MEDLVNLPLRDAMRSLAGRRVWLSGNTGFVGSWLGLWLAELGCDVEGFSLAPDGTRHSGLLAIPGLNSRVGDVRDAQAVSAAFARFQPEVVFHLAAQALVLDSYDDPLSTFATNVMGTAHVLDAVRSSGSVCACLIVTSDKCYSFAPRPHLEVDPLGGNDPYSASKAGAEIVVQSYRASFFDTGKCSLASARAGNIYGGGDWARNRLIPDIVRAIETGRALSIRSPHAIRPWQHVLDAIAGYLRLMSAMLVAPADMSSAWNFGPPTDREVSVLELVDGFLASWKDASNRATPELVIGEAGPPERGYLTLDSTRAIEQLGWHPVLSLEEGLAWSAEWYALQLDGSTDLVEVARSHLARYLEREAHRADAPVPSDGAR